MNNLLHILDLKTVLNVKTWSVAFSYTSHKFLLHCYFSELPVTTTESLFESCEIVSFNDSLNAKFCNIITCLFYYCYFCILKQISFCFPVTGQQELKFKSIFSVMFCNFRLFLITGLSYLINCNGKTQISFNLPFSWARSFFSSFF